MVKPAPTRRPASMSVIFGPAFLQIRLPAKAPRQKKHIVSVKLNASEESLHSKTDLNGILRIDQAYKTPENSIEKTPIARYNQRTDVDFVFIK